MRFFKYTWNLCYATAKKIGIALFHLIFITVFCTLPHELGHALAANLFSCGVKHIKLTFISSSPTIFSFNLLGCKIELGKIPLIFGYTRYKITHSWSRKEQIIMASAGLLVNLLLVLLAWWAESKIENKFWKKFFKMVKEYNFLTIIFNFLAVLWSPNCDVRRVFSLLFRRG